MSTAGEGGAAANANTSSYGGGGAGGKFRKKPFRRQATPYDRPPASVRVNSTNSNDNSSWLTKLVVKPASKLISYGADRFFGSVFRRRLPPPPPPQTPETNAQESDEDQGEDLNSQGGEQVPERGQCSQPINSSSNGVAELEHLLKQKTFNRSEIAHLAELLQSRAAEVSPGEASRMNVVSTSDSGRQKEFASCISEGNRNDGIRITSSPVLENDIASPAELAKAYMGNRPSQVSPSVLGMRNQLGRVGTGLLSDTPVASKSPIMSLAKRTYVGLGAAENGFVTPRPRGRSAIYSMARTPYSRVHPTSIQKGKAINSSGYAGPSTSLRLPSSLENEGTFSSRSGTLKRRSSDMDDEMGSVGPMRRIRQKPNLLASRLHHTAHGVGLGSLAKQKPQLNGEERNKVLKNSGENENESVPSTSYAHVPPKCKEVASKILEQLEKISPKGKSSESKLGAMPEKSPSKSMSSSVTGRALQSTEDIGPSRLLYVQDDLKSGNKTNDTLPDVHESSPGKQAKAEGTVSSVSLIPSGRWNSVLNNDSAVSLKASTPGDGAADSVMKNGAFQPKKKRAFRMSAEEGSLELDDVECNGLASHTKPAGESKTTLQSKDKSFLGIISKSTSEHHSGAAAFGKETSVVTVPASEGIRAASQSQNFSPSVPAFDKPKEANSPHLFSFSSKAADNFPSLSSQSTKRVTSEPERSSSLANISTSAGCEIRTPEPETGFHLKPLKDVDTNGKVDDFSSAALNGTLVSSCFPVSFPAAPPSDNHRISTASVPLFTSSTSISSSVPTGSSTSTSTASSSLSGWALKDEPVHKFGSAVDVPTASITGRADQGANIDIDPSSGSSTSSLSTFSAAASSGNNNLKLGSSFSNSTGNTFQSSIFASATKSPVFGAGTISQGTVSSASVPVLNINTGASLGSLPSPSNFGFNSSTSSSDTTSLVPTSGPTSSIFKFGATPSAASQGFAASSSIGATTPIFGLGGTSFSSSAVSTSSSFSSEPSGMFGFGGSSSASSSTTNSVSSNNSPSNVFGSGWQSGKSPLFGTPLSSASSPSSGFSFSASNNAAAPMAFNSSTGASSNPNFSFTAATTSALPPHSLPNPQPVFGIGGGFGASPGNDQMNAEDSMAEDPVPSSAPIPPGFGQPSVPPAFTFGSSAPPQNNPFMFSGQQNQAPLQNPSPLGSLEYNAGGSFSLGSTGGDKSGRKMVKISRSKNRKK